MDQPKITAILLSGGNGKRFGSQTPKQYHFLGDHPIILHSYQTLSSCQNIQEVIVVCEKEYQPLFPESTTFALPGKRRQDSVENGLLAASHPADYYLIHDGARPFLTREILQRVISSAIQTGASAAAIPISDTIRKCSPTLQGEGILPREELYAMQTPQCLSRDILKQGLQYAKEHQTTATDDLMFAEWIGSPVQIVLGAPENFKVTHEEDLAYARFLHQKQSAPIQP